MNHEIRGTLLRRIFRVLLAAFMMFAGVAHFVNPEFFVRMVPTALGDPWILTWVSGVCEFALGVALLVPRTRRLAGWGLVALFVAVLPANINMALHPNETGAGDVPSLLLWLRLLLQPLLMALAVWVSRREQRPSDAGGSSAAAP